MTLISFALVFLADSLGFWQSWHDFFTKRDLDWTFAHWLAYYDYAGYVIFGIIASLLFVDVLLLIFYRRYKKK